MKTMPEIQAERQRLLQRLDNDAEAIRDEMDSIVSDLHPLNLLGNMVDGIFTEPFQPNHLEMSRKVAQLAINALPYNWTRHPLLATGIRLAMPWLLEKAKGLGYALNKVISWKGVRDTIEDTIAGMRRAFRQK